MNNSDFEEVKNKKIFYDETQEQTDMDKTVSVFGGRNYAKPKSDSLPWEKKKSDVDYTEPKPVAPKPSYEEFNDKGYKPETNFWKDKKRKIILLGIAIATVLVISVAIVLIFIVPKAIDDITLEELCDTRWRYGSESNYNDVVFFIENDQLYCVKSTGSYDSNSVYLSFGCIFDEESNKITSDTQSFQYTSGKLYDEGNMCYYSPVTDNK